MRITELHITNFKRFTDLKIEGIPATAKLVLLIGANGSGKSSVFDAFNYFSFNATSKNSTYYRKDTSAKASVEILFGDKDKTSITITENSHLIVGKMELEKFQKSFYGRSSVRIIPRIQQGGAVDTIQQDGDRPESFIDPDLRFNNDVYEYIQQINNALREPVFKGQSADTVKIFNDFIKPLNDSLEAIFGSDEGTAIRIKEFQDATPHKLPQLVFSKGTSTIGYELLSHGEKQVIILLLNFIVRNKYHQDTIFYIDEMDCHLNTSLQKKLLQEITEKWIPENSQLWTASHALGFIDYARESEQAVIIDLDSYNFDQPVVLRPEPKDSLDVYEIAVPRQIIFDMLKDKKLVVCENKNDEYYNLVGIENTVFVGVKDSRDVFLNVKREERYHGLRDRDFLSDTEIDKLKKSYPKLHILKYYDFENYIYHPDNIAELKPEGFDRNAYAANILEQKRAKFPYITATIVSSRMGYEEFKTDEKLKDKNADAIIDDFNSDEFERFYKYFDMKQQFDKSYIAPFNLSKEDLVKTNWFKHQLATVLQ